MHLIETYALSTGSKIGKPFIVKKFFPLPCSRYITIQNSSGMTGKCYDYFQDVVDFLYEKLEKFGYKIIQIGAKDDKALQRVINLQGQTDLNQTAFILDNSSLHIGNDSFAVHMCSAFDVPLVALYSISSPEIAGPFWKNDKQICLTPKNWKPSFNPNEFPKRINEIPMEKIISAVEKLLFNNNEINIETINIGDRYPGVIIECMPDQILAREFFQNHLINLRFDYCAEIAEKEYNGALNNLNIRPCAIITDKPFNLQPFLQFKERLSAIFYDITNEVNLDFINQLNFFGFKCSLVFNKDKNTEEELNNRKSALIDIPQHIEEISDKSIEIENFDNVFYKSCRILIADQKIYLSRAAQLEDKFITDLNSSLVQSVNDINNKQMLLKEDLAYAYIFRQTS